MQKEYLSNIDTALVHFESPTNPMTITGIMTFEEPVSFERFKATVESRLLAMRRFRQRVVGSPFSFRNPCWVEDPDLDLAYHLQRATLPPPGDRAALQRVVSLLASLPLDLSKPPWQFHLIENYAACCAFVCRIHHCIGDGMAVLHAILSLTDTGPDAPWPSIKPAVREHRDKRGSAAWPTSLRINNQAVRRLAGDGYEMLAHPSRLAAFGRAGGEGVLDLARFLLLKPDPDTVLMGTLSEAKEAAWSSGVRLADIGTIRRALGGTVNDVVVTVIAGALRRYLQARGEPVDEIALRAAVPVNLRQPGKEGALGNRMGAVFLRLPVWNPDPACRLRDIVWHMTERKESSEAPLFYVLLHVLGMTPARLAKSLVQIYGTRASAVITNVKGPQEQLYLAGVPIDDFMAWVPQTGSIGLGISIFSYAGLLRVGVLADADLVPDPAAIVTAFHEEFSALLACALEAAEEASAGWAPAAGNQGSVPPGDRSTGDRSDAEP
jgi:diacylglycerol O-acyltransferase